MWYSGWVRRGTLLYRFLIFAGFLNLNICNADDEDTGGIRAKKAMDKHATDKFD